MVTEDRRVFSDVVAKLRSSSWMEVEQGVRDASKWLQQAQVGSSDAQPIVDELASLASHPKWEVRRALAVAAGECRHPALDPVLVRLAADVNARVQQAAQSASVRLRDWRSAGLLGREHERRLEALLESVYIRFGSQGRAAVYRAANEMTSTFARELNHELVKWLTPLERELERLKGSTSLAPPDLGRVQRIERDVAQLRAVLSAMREYSAVPDLDYAKHELRALVAESIRTVEAVAHAAGVEVNNRIAESIEAPVSRTRLVQALSNVLHNAVEAYSDARERRPIEIDGEESEGLVTIRVRDHGCGMTAEAQLDARTLFATSKPQGTGVGLPLAIKIIESEHDGRLDIESELESGTSVVISIPRFRNSGP